VLLETIILNYKISENKVNPYLYDIYSLCTFREGEFVQFINQIVQLWPCYSLFYT